MSAEPKFGTGSVTLHSIEGGKSTHSQKAKHAYIGKGRASSSKNVAGRALTAKSSDRQDQKQPTISSDSSMEPMESFAKDYVDQKFETERAKTDSRFGEVLSEIRMLKQASLSKGQFWAGVATTVASILGALLAVLAFAGDRFDAGINLSDDLSAIEARQSERDAAQDDRLDQILTAIEALRVAQP